MGSKTLLVIFSLLACSGLGEAIKCYACAGSSTSDCAKGKISGMSTINCKHSSQLLQNLHMYFSPDATVGSDGDGKPVCLELVETGYEPDIHVRSCGVFPSNVDACEFLKANANNIVSCKACKTDLCNNRSKSLP